MKKKLTESDLILSCILFFLSIIGFFLGLMILLSIIKINDSFIISPILLGIILICTSSFSLFYSIYIFVKFKKQNN